MFMDVTLTQSVAPEAVKSIPVLHPTRAGDRHSTGDNLSGSVHEAK